jgi:N6-L-threonylcarbamoyladenine synthase
MDPINSHILAIETSCDETAASLIKFRSTETNFEIEVLSNAIASQIDIHKKWGGVFPELASRAHLEAMIPVLEEALLPLAGIRNKEVGSRGKTEETTPNSLFVIPNSVSAIAVTQGPGLIGSLLMGTETANILASHFDKPLISVNHLEGHVYSAFAKTNKEEGIKNNEKKSPIIPNSSFLIPKKGIFPILALVVSGGHTSLILMKDHLQYETVGQTIDDAAGEAFDKVSKLMELGYPGGPIIERLAESGDENKYDLPVAMKDSCDFSFSGLKTAVLYMTKDPRTKEKLEYNQADLAASFQKAVVDALILKTKKAVDKYQPKTLILGGGVSANGYLRKRFISEISLRPTPCALPPTILIPPKNLSTDNAVGIAIAAALKFCKNQTTNDLVEAKANFPIDAI